MKRNHPASHHEAAGAQETLRDVYRRLYVAFGPQHWWPAKTPLEVVVGAILTQNTAWTNVERAIASLARADALDWRRLRDLSEEELAGLIRSAGTYRLKAKRLKTFVDALWRDHGGCLEAMLGGDLEDARRRLLAIHGIGPETADAILLYAGGRPTFVVDAYTKRFLRRHHLIDGGAGYEHVRGLFQESITPDGQVYNEYHALLVELGKRHCRTKASCEGCPLAELPHE